jgi:hypothetical protein
MGWMQDISGKTLRQMIKKYTEETPKSRLLKMCFKGNPAFAGVLWTVWEIDCKDGVTRRLIGCDRMEYWRSKSGNGWSVKSMDETVGPCYYHCPLSYLQIASGPNSFEDQEFSKEWREKVRGYHSKKKAKKSGVLQVS